LLPGNLESSQWDYLRRAESFVTSLDCEVQRPSPEANS
jgi:hypothetical protein